MYDERAFVELRSRLTALDSAIEEAEAGHEILQAIQLSDAAITAVPQEVDAALKELVTAVGALESRLVRLGASSYAKLNDGLLE